MFYNLNAPVLRYVREQDYSTDVQFTSGNQLPTQYRLRPNFPNPFNPSTNISFALPKDDFVSLTVFDLNGRQIKTLVNSKLAAGIHSFSWNGRDENNVG